MGCSGLSFSYSTEEGYRPAAGNPVPSRFKIVDSYEGVGGVCVKINYPDCNNYEGDKILVFKGYSMWHIGRLCSIDPHFSDTEPAPFARFKPTKEGWYFAMRLADDL